MKATAAVLIAALALSGCASRGYRPIVDTQGVDMAQYQRDLAECQAYAQQVDAPATAATGAVLGAVLSAALGAAFGLRGASLSQTAAAGATVGGTHGAAAGASAQINIVRNCMAGRGYRVLL